MADDGKKASDEIATKSGPTGTDSRARDLEIIKKNIAKRSVNVKFDLDNTNYRPIEKIGIGAYGVVCSAIHKKSTDKVPVDCYNFVFSVCLRLNSLLFVLSC